LFVQPTLERLSAIAAVCQSAGPTRLVVLLNPQYRCAETHLFGHTAFSTRLDGSSSSNS
jgi:hypothetical protein